MKLYQAIAQNARLIGSAQWGDAAAKRAERIADMLPSGSGFDAGTKLVSADDQKIVLSTSFHHMNETGFYDGWTEHVVTVRASLASEICVSVSGRNRNEIKTYICEVFGSLMLADFSWL